MMEAKLPSSSDLPSSLKIDIIPPPNGKQPANILILLHGLGDTQVPFTQFADAMKLPETAAVAICASTRLPFDLPGYHWGDDMVFDQATGEMDVDTGFKNSIRVIQQDVIITTLIGKCSFKPRQIMLFGFGQGGFAALGIARAMNEELGGVVSIGGGLSLSTPVSDIGKSSSKTPILICKSRGSILKDSDIKRIGQNFNQTTVTEWSKARDTMPGNHDEMLPIMQFFGRRLLSFHGVLKGSVSFS